MDTKKLIEAIKVTSMVGALPGCVGAVQFDSRRIGQGDLFVAVRGESLDGHQYIERAIVAGAKVVVCQHLDDLSGSGALCGVTFGAVSHESDVCFLVVEDSALALAQLAARYYGEPSTALKLVGITGTNGKTTTATLLHELFSQLGHRCGLISTVVNKVADECYDTIHTTPDPLTVNALLRQMVEEGCEYCFMEVSSHGVVQKRVAGLSFAGGVFTNLTHDHLDYHKTFAEYIKAKKGFFDALPSNSFALVNADDRNGEVMIQNCRSARCRRYSLQRMADYNCKILESTLEGMLLEINRSQVWTRLLGRFNAYNLTAIYGVALELGVAAEVALAAISKLGSVAGRMECYRGEGGVLGIVDYAHTPDALENVLRTINDFRSSGSSVITVVGCGGDRDTSKRPVMARIAASLSDRAILTSDNPRTEDPNAILEQMRAGVADLPADQQSKVLVIESRHDAIMAAVAFARSGDVVLVAGKGHESYQEIHGVRHHFDDRQQLFGALGAPAPDREMQKSPFVM